LRRGRFRRPMEPLSTEYTSSTRGDVKIFYPTVRINIAHTIMLAECRVISKKDAAALLRALISLHEGGISKLDLRPELEDIHMAVEEFVARAAGEEIGGKLHTAKSRNDQVSAAIRMALREDLLELGEGTLKLVDAMMSLAEENIETIMPGYTHLQIAEPTTFAHYLLAYCSAFLRGVDRISEAYDATNSSPMGSCAFAGTSFSIDRHRVSSLLGFQRIDENTMDAVSSRDFALQAMSAIAVLMVNLSRLSEELTLWSSAEFDMIEIPDEFVSTSSIMPQKRNPVVAEIARAKAGRVLGNLAGALAIVKALPQAYDLDLQELTPLLWNSVEEARKSVEVMGKMMAALKPKKQVMRERSERGFSVAAEIADMLVREAELSFRDAHSVVGRMVARAIEAGKSAKDLEVEDLRSASREVLGNEVAVKPEVFKAALEVDGCVSSRALPGGPAPGAVMKQLKLFRKRSKILSNLMKARKSAIKKSESDLLREARRRTR
jgi:argininosuccinate lyase